MLYTTGAKNYNTNLITECVLDVLKVQSRLGSDFQSGLYSWGSLNPSLPLLLIQGEDFLLYYLN